LVASTIFSCKKVFQKAKSTHWKTVLARLEKYQNDHAARVIVFRLDGRLKTCTSSP
jgi:hypothetical protein